MSKLDNYVKTFFGVLFAGWVAKLLLPVLGLIVLIVLVLQLLD